MNPFRTSRSRVGLACYAVGGALALAALVMAIGPARAAAASSGSAVVVKPSGDAQAGAPLTTGTSHTNYSLKLPSDAACSGDGLAGYRVTSYMVPASVDPGTLTYDTDGPQPSGLGADFRQPLWKTDTNPYTGQGPQTGDGKIINIPTFTVSVFTIDDVPAGDYKLGLACTKPAPDASATDKFWLGTITIVADGTDPNGFRWTSTAAPVDPSSTTSSSTSTSTTVAGTGSSTTSTSTTLAGGATSTTSTTRVTTTSTTSGSGTAATTPTTRPSFVAATTARTGSNLLPIAFAAVVFAMLGRMFFLTARPASAAGDES